MEISCLLLICICLIVLRVSSIPAELLTSHTQNKILTAQSPQNNTSALPASINATQLSNLPNVVCLNHFGSNLGLASCQNAVSKIPYDNNPLTFGMRDAGNFDVPLPIRYLSDDGRCAVDVFPDGLGLPDAATSHQIALAASLTLEKCIVAQSPTTGGIGYTGAHKGLSVQLTSSSLQVKCTETRMDHTAIPQYASCQTLLSKMPWSQQYTVFGPPGQPGVQVGLPSKWPSEDTKCWLFIYSRDSTQPQLRRRSDVETWSVLWAAAVAVNEMCTKRGKLGIALELGELVPKSPRDASTMKLPKMPISDIKHPSGTHKRLFVSFVDPRSPSPSAQLAQSTAAADVAVA